MLDKDKLRKADIYSGAIISLFGIWIVSQALKMPMKDSWGGVQNVWYVSPALFPLCIGGIITILGAFLCRTALKSVGTRGFKETINWFMSKELFEFLNSLKNLRFYTMAVLFFSFVFLNIPRIDFFICAVLFLVVFITSFYFDDPVLLKKLFFFYLLATIVLLLFFITGLNQALRQIIPFPGDFLTACIIIVYCTYVRMLIRNDAALRRKYWIALLVSFIAPFSIGILFKYFLLVPMPSEGLIVSIIDYFWYLEF